MFWILLGIYAAWCLLLYFMQDRMMFPRDLLNPPTPEAAIPPIVQRLWIDLKPGVRIEAWYIPPESAVSGGEPAPCVICTHGNAELIDECLGDAAHWRQRGFGVLLCEYRGYGRSGGSPSQDAIVADMLAFYDLIAARPDVDRDCILAHGRSVGAAVAAQLAARRSIAGMVLESPFRSAASFALRFGVPTFLMKSPFRTERVLPGYAGPILIFHGRQDDIIPVSHSRRLHELCPGSTLVELQGGHNSGLSGQTAYWEAADQWLRDHDLLARR